MGSIRNKICRNNNVRNIFNAKYNEITVFISAYYAHMVISALCVWGGGEHWWSSGWDTSLYTTDLSPTVQVFFDTQEVW